MSMSKSTQHRILYWLSGLIVLYAFVWPLVAGTLSVFIDWDREPSVWAKILFFGVPMISTVVLVAGLVIHAKNPRRGLPFIVAGAIGPAVWVWMLPLYAPFMIAVIALAIAITPRKSTQIAAT